MKSKFFLAVATALAVTVAAPAANAAPGDTSTTVDADDTDTAQESDIPTVDNSAVVVAPPSMNGTLRERFDSLSSAMVGAYAQNNGIPLSQLGQQNPALVPLFDDINVMSASEEITTLEAPIYDVDITTPSALESPSIDSSSFDFENWFERLNAPEFAADRISVGLGADWTNNLSARYGNPVSSGPQSPESLLVGLYTTTAAANLVSQSPELIDTIKESGVGDPQTQQAWSAALETAGSTLNTGLSSGLLDPCTATLMSTMVSGDPAAAYQIGGQDCAPCIAHGQFLKNQVDSLYGIENVLNTVQPNDGVVTPFEANASGSFWISAQESEALTSQLAQQRRGQTATVNSPKCGSAATTQVGSNVVNDTILQLTQTPPGTGQVIDTAGTPFDIFND